MSISFPKGHYIFYLAPQAEERTEDNILNVNFLCKETNPSYPNSLRSKLASLRNDFAQFFPHPSFTCFQQKSVQQPHDFPKKFFTNPKQLFAVKSIGYVCV